MDTQRAETMTLMLLFTAANVHTQLWLQSRQCAHAAHIRDDDSPLRLLGCAEVVKEVNGSQDRVPDKQLDPAASVGRERCTKGS